MIKCKNCGSYFQPRRSWQRFCSKECKSEHERLAHDAARAAAGQLRSDGKNPAAVVLGRLGAAARNRKYGPEERAEISRRSAATLRKKRALV